MERLESQQIDCLMGERSSQYEVILWGRVASDELYQEGLFEDFASNFAVEVREVWTPLFEQQPTSRQVSRIEISSRGVAQQIYHYTAETLHCL